MLLYTYLLSPGVTEYVTYAAINRAANSPPRVQVAMPRERAEPLSSSLFAGDDYIKNKHVRLTQPSAKVHFPFAKHVTSEALP